MRRAAGWLLAAAVAIAVALEARAQSESPPAYRRVFVPREALAGQISGLLPMKREEFERRVQALSRGDWQRRPGQARVEEAVFRARLVGDRLEEGVATFSIVAGNQSPALVELEPLGLIVRGARWVDTEPRDAVIGIDERGKAHCLVERDGRLELKWSLGADDAADDEVSFSLRLPSATRRQLEVVAPKDVELVCDAGVVQHAELADEELSERLWTIELAGGGASQLTARQKSMPTASRPRLVVRETSSYSLLPASLDIETTFVCDAQGRAAGELEFTLQSPLVPTAIRVDDQEAAYEFESSATDGEPGSVRVRLPAPLQPGRHVVQLSATGEWLLDSGRKLPQVELTGAVLQDAEREVTAPAWLALVAEPVGACAQTAASPAGPGRSVDQFRFHVFGPDGGVQVEPLQASRPLRERSGTLITVEPNQILGVLVAELMGQGREIFEIEAEVPRQWIIDSVETLPPTMLADRALSARGAGPQRLVVRLAQPILSGERALKLVLRGHFRRPASGELRGAAFQMATFPAAAESRRLVSLQVNDPAAEPVLSGDETLVRHTPMQLSAQDRELFEGSLGSLVFEANSGSDALVARLKPAAANYAADVFLRAMVLSSGSEHSAVIRCQPETTALAALAIRLAPRPQAPVQWQLLGDEPRELSAVVEADPTAEDAAIYRLTLPRTTSAEIQVQGQWMSENGPVSLVWIPEASRQTTIVEVDSALGNVRLEEEGLRRLPPAPSHTSSPLRCLARYAYETGQPARLAVRLDAESESRPRAWVEALDVLSHLGPSGGLENVATMKVHRASAGHIAMRLPEGVVDCRLHGEREQVLLRNLDGEFEIPLSSQTGSLQLRYRSLGAALGVWPVGRVALPLPEVDVPVLSQTWRLALPPGIAAATDSWLLTPPGLRMGDPAFREWRVFSREVQKGQAAAVTVFHVPVLLAWSFAACLAMFPAGWWFARSGAWTIAIACLLAAAVVVFNSPWSWIALGGWMGLLLGAAWGIAGTLRDASSSAMGRTVLAPTAAAFLFFVALSGLQSRWLAGAEPPSEAPGGRVLYPIDENDEPSGEYVYVEPALYEALHGGEPTRRTTYPAWLLEEARYELSSLPQDAAEGQAVVEIKISLHLRTFAEGATVPLPLRKDQISLLPGRTKLDEGPASLVWDDKGEQLTLLVAAPGEHRLDMAVAAAARVDGDGWVIRAVIPPALAASVIVPRDGKGKVHAPQGIPRTLTDGRRSLEIGSTGRLELRFSGPAGDGPAATDPEAEKLLWWKVRPASVVLEAQLRLRSAGEPLKQVRLHVDPRLRYLPSLASGPIARVVAGDNANMSTTIELTEPARDVRLRLGWLWPDAAASGTLVLPQVDVIEAAESRDWTAVSLEQGLAFGDFSEDAKRLETAEFVRTWGSDGGPPPSVAFAGPAPAGGFMIALRPEPKQMTAQQVSEWKISRTRARLRATVRLDNVSSSAFSHRLLVPEGVTVNKVSLIQGDRAVNVRWWQPSSGQVTIASLEAPAAAQTLVIEGELASRPPPAELRLPPFRLDDAEEASCELRLYRQPDVSLALPERAGWIASESSLAEGNPDGMGRLFTVLHRGEASDPAGPVVSRRPNRPGVNAQMQLAVTMADEDWQTELALKLDVAAGVLDHVRLAVPDDWPGDFRLEPAWPYRMAPAASEGRRLLTITPPQGLSGSAAVKLVAPLAVSSLGVETPDIRLVDVENVEQHLVLDRGSTSAPIDWETTGLVPADSEQASAPEDGSHTVSRYRVVATPFRARARLRPSPRGTAQIPFAELVTEIHDNERVVTSATFVVIPAGDQEVAFELPAQSRLIDVLVDGSSLEPARTGLRTWEIAAPSDALPFELTITYDTAIAPAKGAGSRRLAAPRIAGLKASAAVWSVRSGPTAEARLNAADELLDDQSVRQCSLNEAEVLRLEAVVRALEAVQAARGSAIPPSVLIESFTRWQRDADAASKGLGANDNLRTFSEELERRRQAALAAAASVRQRLVQAGMLSEDFSAIVAAAPQQPPARATQEPCFLVPELNEGLPLATPPPASPPMPWRTIAATILALAAVGAPRLVRRTTALSPGTVT